MLRRLLIIVLAGHLPACATVDFDYPRNESRAFADTRDTSLGRQLDDLVSGQPGLAGFAPLEDGVEALAARLALAERAERSIDAQYFLIHNDIVGRVFVEALLRAADRGVRVRLLVDDIHTDGLDPGFASLATHPNFEIRLFNPFGHRSVKALNAPSLRRVVRRMHNKSFTVDNQVTILGGRNIGDEYFGAPGRAVFGDLDVLGVGPVVQDVSSMFDAYWNHRSSLPIQALTSAPARPEQALSSIRTVLARSRMEITNTPYGNAVRGSSLALLEGGHDSFTFAPHRLVYDPPDKAMPGGIGASQSITASLRASISDAQSELLIVTPYFVLRKQDLDGFRELRDRGIAVTAVTNSLASNNHTISHSGYRPVRKPLLEMGVSLYEVRADAKLPGEVGIDRDSARTTLHAKAFIVDRRRLFIGSFNWNQRSKNVDTEMGVIVESPELAAAWAARMDDINLDNTYEVFLTDEGKVRWRGRDNGQEIVLTREPQTNWWQRFSAGFLSVLPIKSQL